MQLTLTSTAFSEGGLVPKKYSCDGQNVNPELSWSGAPVDTKSFVLIMDDPDIPDSVKQSRGIDVFDHWVVYNIPATVTELKEATKPEGQDGLNGAGKPGYTGPCPPDKEHRYFFYIFALDTTLSFNSPPTKADVMAAMIGHVLANGQLMGRYNRSPQ
jgi:Raf kinase inhibitor-like YbhB/YbcL family protein